MKKVVTCLLLFVAWSVLPAFTCWAYDFTDMSNQELYEFWPSLKFATDTEKQTYWDEWDKREKMMTVQEKEKYSDDLTKAQQIKFLYTPGMGYEGPISVGKDIYGSATRPVYKPIQERQIYGIQPKEEEKKEKENKAEKEESEQ